MNGGCKTLNVALQCSAQLRDSVTRSERSINNDNAIREFLCSSRAAIYGWIVGCRVGVFFRRSASASGINGWVNRFQNDAGIWRDGVHNVCQLRAQIFPCHAGFVCDHLCDHDQVHSEDFCVHVSGHHGRRR